MRQWRGDSTEQNIIKRDILRIKVETTKPRPFQGHGIPFILPHSIWLALEPKPFSKSLEFLSRGS
jgi:hypothetical protein